MCRGPFSLSWIPPLRAVQHDGTAVVYYAVDTRPGIQRLTILDWDVVQIDGALLEEWIPSVFTRLNELSGQCVAVNGSLGVFIEDASMAASSCRKAKARDGRSTKLNPP